MHLLNRRGLAARLAEYVDVVLARPQPVGTDDVLALSLAALVELHVVAGGLHGLAAGVVHHDLGIELAGAFAFEAERDVAAAWKR